MPADVRAVKMPPPVADDPGGELAALRERTGLAVGYSGDWVMADTLLAGADAFYSVLGGLLPHPVVALARAARQGDAGEARRIDAALSPLWRTFQAHGSLRVMYGLLDLLGLGRHEPPRPLLPLGPAALSQVEEAVAAFRPPA